MTIRVVLVDDHDAVRAGFALILGGHADIEIVGEASDGIDAATLVRATQPDVCMVDIQMPRMNGLELARLLATTMQAPPRIVFLTTFDLDDYVTEAIGLGASGFVLKHAEPQLLISAVRAAAGGDALISPQITTRLLSKIRDKQPPSATATLSKRERDVVLAVAQGMTNNEICESLHLSLSTVKAHLSSAQNKTGTRNRVEVAVWAWRTGLIGRV